MMHRYTALLKSETITEFYNWHHVTCGKFDKKHHYGANI